VGEKGQGVLWLGHLSGRIEMKLKSKPLTFAQRYLLAAIHGNGPAGMVATTLWCPPSYMPLYGDAPLGITMHTMLSLVRRGLVEQTRGFHKITKLGREEYVKPVPQRSASDISYQKHCRGG
jgi:hypothetical protein